MNYIKYFYFSKVSNKRFELNTNLIQYNLNNKLLLVLEYKSLSNILLSKLNH